MRRALKLCLSSWFLILGLLALAGCGKDPTPPRPLPPRTDSSAADRPAPADVPAPTIRLSASPSSVERRSQSTLSWQTTNASSVVIDNGVGNVAEQGSVVVTPLQSTTYTAIATGAGGEARASARVTVIEPAAGAPLADDQVRLEELIRQGAIKDVFFAYDKAELTEEAMAALRQNAIHLRELPQARILIEGHCDERGSEEYNLALGDRRARAAFDFLAQLGVEPERMNTISFGEERPFDPGHSEAAWAKNRRAHFVGSR